jgi:predicted dehydrogenase
MTEEITWGILGCARITRRGLIPGIQGSQTGRLAALASRDGDKARRWATEFGIPKAYSSYEDLLRDRDITAVYLPLPNELHLPWTLRAAAAGKHVLCDKPLGLNVAEAEEMVAECRRRGVVLMEGFMWRHHPRTTKVVELVRAGRIGDVRLVRCSFSFDIDRDDWRLDPRRGGGALWDVGCYGVNTCRLICDAEPLDVTGTARWWPSGVDMTLVATLRFPNGAIGQIDCSFELPYRCHFEVVGTRGAIEVPDAYVPGDSPAVVVRCGESAERLTVPASNQYAAMVDHFSRCVAAGRTEGPAEDGLTNMRVLDAVLAAARGTARM